MASQMSGKSIVRFVYGPITGTACPSIPKSPNPLTAPRTSVISPTGDHVFRRPAADVYCRAGPGDVYKVQLQAEASGTTVHDHAGLSGWPKPRPALVPVAWVPAQSETCA